MPQTQVGTPWRDRNPLGQSPTRFRERPRVHVRVPGQTPGTMEHEDDVNEQAVGTIRRLWRQTLSGTPAPPPYPVALEPAEFTRALRYKAASTYKEAGSLNTRFSMLHTVIRMVSRQPRPTYTAGTRRARPTVRNRMTSFGARVQPLNRRAPAAQREDES